MTRMPEAVELDVVAGPGAEGAQRATGRPGPVTTSGAPDPNPEVPATVQSGGASPQNIGSAFSSKPTPARSPARWAPCCGARGCTRRCWRTGGGSARRAPCGRCAGVAGGRRPATSTRA